jgi:hypothetical protein
MKRSDSVSWVELMKLLLECGDADPVGTQDALLAVLKRKPNEKPKRRSRRF